MQITLVKSLHSTWANSWIRLVLLQTMAKKMFMFVVSYIYLPACCLEMSAVVRHSFWLLFAEVASLFLSSFFVHVSNTQEPPHAVLTPLCMEWGVFHAPVAECHQGVQQIWNFNSLKKSNTVPVFLSVVNPDSPDWHRCDTDEKDTTMYCRPALLWIKVKLKYQIFQRV